MKKGNVNNHLKNVHEKESILLGNSTRKQRKETDKLSKSYLRRKGTKLAYAITEATDSNEYLKIQTMRKINATNDHDSFCTKKLEPLDKDELIELVKTLGNSDRKLHLLMKELRKKWGHKISVSNLPKVTSEKK